MAQLTVTHSTDYRGMTEMNVSDIVFANTGQSFGAVFNASQFGAGLISNNVTITGGDNAANYIEIHASGTFSAAGWEFSNWNSQPNAYDSDVISIFTSAGNDSITGSVASDHIALYGGVDHISTGQGADQIIVNAAVASGTTIDGGTNSAGTHDDLLVNFSFVDLTGATVSNVEDLFFGFNQSQTVFLTGDQIGMSGFSSVNGGSMGASTLIVQGPNVDLSTVQFNGWNSGDSVTLVGTSAYVNYLAGSSQNDFVSGNNTAVDVASGGGGQDTLNGYGGADTLDGSVGNDVLDGGTGNDSLTGGIGNDLFKVDSASDRVIEATNGGTDTVSASTSYFLQGGQSVEFITASSPTSTYAINLAGNELAQTITGNDGINYLTGNAGNDTLQGGGGNDFLNGGAGRDLMDGGTGNDVFTLASVGDSTSITRDIVLSINFAQDKFDVTIVPTSIHAQVNGGQLRIDSAVHFDADLTAAIGTGQLANHQAVLFDPDDNASIGNHLFLIVDANGQAGYQAGGDYVIELVNASGMLTTEDFS